MKNNEVFEALDKIKEGLILAESLVDDVKMKSSKELHLVELEALPSKLRSLRKEQKITQEALASIAGVSIGLISKIEDGDLNISLQKLKNILDVFGVSICFK